MQTVVSTFDDFFGQRPQQQLQAATTRAPASYREQVFQTWSQPQPPQQPQTPWWEKPPISKPPAAAPASSVSRPVSEVKDNVRQGLAATHKAPHQSQRRLLTEDEALDLFADQLVADNIRLVCFDFDKTLVPHPTGTDRLSRVDRLVMTHEAKVDWSRDRITPLFPKLVCALRARGIHVAICTFNESDLLRDSFKGYLDGGRKSIPVFARQDSAVGTGKLYHMQEAMTSLNRHLAKKKKTNEAAGASNLIGPDNTMLIDDLQDNVDKARLWKLGGVIHNKDVFTVEDLLGWVKESRARRRQLKVQRQRQCHTTTS